MELGDVAPVLEELGWVFCDAFCPAELPPHPVSTRPSVARAIGTPFIFFFLALGCGLAHAEGGANDAGMAAIQPWGGNLLSKKL
jgi:hypothetical protein